MDDSLALLVTGAFGTGKSSVVEEAAELLEATLPPFAAIDLDWLAWSNAPGADHDEHTILGRNLAAVAAIYREAGVRRFLLAGSIGDSDALAAVREAVGMPVVVVRLTAPIDVIEARLGGAPTSGRADDLERARAWLEAGTGEGLEAYVVENAGPVRDAALRVLAVAGWRPPNV